ncbi:MAG: hypothetical protein HY456_00715 [Parcubacteria group bacterium]|nr:hypothetical protein [Parcubacteria group bacterium]
MKTRPDIGEVLKARGLRGADINLAFQLRDCIEKIDKMIFPASPTRVLVHEASKRNFRAMYTHHRPCGGDYYTVFVKGLHKSLNQEREAGLFMAVKKDGSVEILRHVCPFPSFTPILVAIACHEVRHRLQYNHKIKSLAQELPEDKKSELLHHSLRYVGLLFSEIRKDLRRSDERKRNRIKSATDRWEIDAVAVETMVLHTFRSGDRLRKVVPLLCLGA